MLVYALLIAFVSLGLLVMSVVHAFNGTFVEAIYYLLLAGFGFKYLQFLGREK